MDKACSTHEGNCKYVQNFSWKTEGRSLRKSRRRCAENTKINLKEIGTEAVDCIHLSRDTDRSRAQVNMTVNFPVQ